MSGVLIHVNLGLPPLRPCTRSELHPSSFDLIADVMAWPGLLVILRPSHPGRANVDAVLSALKVDHDMQRSATITNAVQVLTLPMSLIHSNNGCQKEVPACNQRAESACASFCTCLAQGDLLPCLGIEASAFPTSGFVYRI